MSSILFRIYFLLLLVLTSLACNMPTLEEVIEAAPVSSDVIPTDSSIPVETPIPAVTPEEVCIQPTDGETLYINEAGGYCLLIPVGYSIAQELGLDIFVSGPPLESFGQEGIGLSFEISVIGAPYGAGDFTAQTWADTLVNQYGIPGFDISTEPYTLAGVGGVRLSQVPSGQFPDTVAIVRTNDTLYSVSVAPARPGFDQYLTEIDELWAQLSDSVRFFPPMDTGIAYQTPGQVCPQALPATQMVIDYEQGWCTFVLAEWSESADFPNQFIGEIWPGQPGFANIVIANGGPAMAPRWKNMRSDAQIGGYDAVILNTQDGLLPDRVAMIIANDAFYMVLGQPFDSQQYPDATDALEAAWQMIIENMQFFEAYS